MSSSFLNPSLTPRTLFATSARMRPWKARVFFSSSALVKATTLFSTFTAMPGTMRVERVPFGPFTVTASASWRTSTPFGSGISFLPIRDMGSPSLPDLAEDFAAHAAAGGLGAGENTLRRRHDGQTEAAEDAGDLLLVSVHAAARARDALDAVDDRLAVVRVLQIDAQGGLDLVLHHLVVADEALGLEDPGHLHFELRRGELDAVVVGLDAIADPAEEIRDRVSHGHCVRSFYPLSVVGCPLSV